MNRPLTACMTASKNGFVSDGYENNETIKGNAFILETVIEVENNETLNVVVDPRLLDQGFIVQPTYWHTNQNYLEAKLGVCTGYSGGELYENLNKNYLYSATNKEKTIIKAGVDVSLTGFTASKTIIPFGLESTNKNPGGGGREAGGITILDPSLIYVFQIPNATGDTVRIGFIIKFFEINGED